MKNIYLFIILAFAFISCSENKCECTPGHDDYQGHCPCGAVDCQCPVRLHRSFMNGEIECDIWNKDPLTTTDTLFIKITSELWQPTHIIYNYYYYTISESEENPSTIKMVLPKGEYGIKVRLKEKNDNTSTTNYTTIDLLPDVLVI